MISPTFGVAPQSPSMYFDNERDVIVKASGRTHNVGQSLAIRVSDVVVDVTPSFLPKHQITTEVSYLGSVFSDSFLIKQEKLGRGKRTRLGPMNDKLHCTPSDEV